MAEVKDGLPSTDFSRMNREYVKAVAEEAAASGGGNPAVFIGFDEDTASMTSTWQEIKNNIDANKLMYMWVDGDLYLITDVGMSRPNTYTVRTKCISEADGVAGWTTNSPDGYPKN